MPPPPLGKLNLANLSSGGGWGLGDVYSIIPPAAQQEGKSTFKVAATDVAHESDDDAPDVIAEVPAGAPSRDEDDDGSNSHPPVSVLDGDAELRQGSGPDVLVTEPSSKGVATAPRPAGHGNPKLTHSSVSDADTIVDHGSDVDPADPSAGGGGHDSQNQAHAAGALSPVVVLSTLNSAALPVSPLQQRQPPTSPPPAQAGGLGGGGAAIESQGAQKVPPALNFSRNMSDAAAPTDISDSDGSVVWPPGEIVSCVTLSAPVRAMAVEGKELWVAEGARDVMSYTLSGCALTPNRTIPNVNNVTSLCVVPAMPKAKGTGFRNDRPAVGKTASTGGGGGGAGGGSSAAVPSPLVRTQESSMLWCGLDNGKIKVCNLFFATVEFVLESHHSRVHFMFMAPGPRGSYRVWSCSDSQNKSFSIWDAVQCKLVFRDSVGAAICDATVVPPQTPGQKESTIWTCSHFDPHYRIYDLEGKVLKTSTKFQGMGIRAIRYHNETRTVWMCVEQQVVIINAVTFAVQARVNTTSPVLEFFGSSALLVAHGGLLQENEDRIVAVNTKDPAKQELSFRGAVLPGVSVAGLRCISPVLQLFVAAHKVDDQERFLSVFTTCETPVMDNWGVGESAIFQPPRAVKKSALGTSEEYMMPLQRQPGGGADGMSQQKSGSHQLPPGTPPPAPSGGAAGGGNDKVDRQSLVRKYLQHVPDADLMDSGRPMLSAASSQGTRITHRTDELSHHAIESATRQPRPSAMIVASSNDFQGQSQQASQQLSSQQSQQQQHQQSGQLSQFQQQQQPQYNQGQQQQQQSVPFAIAASGSGDYSTMQQQSSSQNQRGGFSAAGPTSPVIPPQIVVDNTKVISQLTDLQRGVKQLLVSKPIQDDFGELYRIVQQLAIESTPSFTAPAGANSGGVAGPPPSLVLSPLDDAEAAQTSQAMSTPEGRAIARMIGQLIKTVREQQEASNNNNGVAGNNVSNSSFGMGGQRFAGNVTSCHSFGGSGTQNVVAESSATPSAAEHAAAITSEAIVKLLQQQSRTSAEERHLHQKELNSLKRQYEALKEKNDALREGVSRLCDDLRRRVAELQRSATADAAAVEQLIREASGLAELSRAATVAEIHTNTARIRKIMAGVMTCAAGTFNINVSDNPLTYILTTNPTSDADITPRESARSERPLRSSRSVAGANASTSNATLAASTGGSTGTGTLQRGNSFALSRTMSGNSLHRRSHSGYLARNVHAMKISERRTLLSVIVAPRITRIEQFAADRQRDLEKMVKDREITHRIKVRKLEQMATDPSEPKIVTMRRLEAADFSFCVAAKDLDLVFLMITLCEHENYSVICGAILGEVIEILREEVEQQHAQWQQQYQGAGNTDSAGLLTAEVGSGPHDRGSVVASSMGDSSNGSARSQSGGVALAPAVNSPVAQLLSEAEALDTRFSYASLELETLAGRIRTELTNLVIRPQTPGSRAQQPGASGASASLAATGRLSHDPMEPSLIPRSCRPTMAKLNGMLYWCTVWLHLLVTGLLQAEAALQSPSLTPDNESGIKIYLGVWSESLATIRRLLSEVKDAVSKLEKFSSDRQASPLLTASTTASQQQSPAPAAMTVGGQSGSAGAPGSAPAVSFVDSADTVDTIARELGSGSQSPSITTTTVTAMLLYFSIVSHGDARTLASPGNTPALLDAAPSKSTNPRRDSQPPGAGGSSGGGGGPGSGNIGALVASQSSSSYVGGHRLQQQQGSDKSVLDHFVVIIDTVGELELKLSRMESSVEKLIKSTEQFTLPEQHPKRSAELPPHLQRLCSMQSEDLY